MKWHKKGIAIDHLVIWIFVILCFLIISGVWSRVYAKAEDKEAENLCQTSVAFRARSALEVGGTEITLTPFLCKTIDKKMTGSREELKEQIAEKMARCWWMFNEGRYDEILRKDILGKVLGVDKSTNDCALCYALPIDQDTIEGGPIRPEEMMRYLRDHPYPKVKDATYLTYIQSSGGTGRVAILDQVAPRDAYGIVFMAKNSDARGLSWIEIGLTAAFTAGAVFCYIAEPCGLVATVAVGATGVAAGGVSGYRGVEALRAVYNSDRTTSAIVFDNLKNVEQSGCLIKDIGGE